MHLLQVLKRQWIGLLRWWSLLFCASACSSIAIYLAPEKGAGQNISQQNSHEFAVEQQDLQHQFWEVFHGGQYDSIQRVLNLLTAAYLKNPTDPETTSHIAFLHAWRLSERERLKLVPATITDEIIVARKYFSEALRLSPRDMRLKGFLATFELIEGTIHGDEKLLRHGYYHLLDAKEAWPEFNLFTAGYTLSTLPFLDSKYKDAVNYQWETLNRCSGKKMDRSNPDYAPFMNLETKVGNQRACWNSWIAPHNFEGFFLNMGDMLVKQGDWVTARKIYKNAKLSKTYDQWPYKSVLEQRIQNAEGNVAYFRELNPLRDQPRMMLQSTFACMACHQAVHKEVHEANQGASQAPVALFEHSADLSKVGMKLGSPWIQRIRCFKAVK